MRDRIIVVAILVGALVWIGHISWRIAVCNVKGGVVVMAPLGTVCIKAEVVE